MPRIPEQIALLTQRFSHHPSRWKRWLATGAGALALVASFFLGVVMLILALGVATAVALFIGVRIWWLRRQWRSDRSGAQARQGQNTGSANRVIEGESRDITGQD